MVDIVTLPASAEERRRTSLSDRPTKPEHGVVHVWQFAVPVAAPAAHEIDTLSCPEKAKANGFRRSEDRTRFLWRRTILREILASYGEFASVDSDYTSGEHGKPALRGSSLSFNCAYSDAWVFIAVASDVQVGVDIERISLERDWWSIADIAFNPDEIAWINRAEMPQDGFAQIWTRREALFKAWGKGLHDSMRETSIVHNGDLISSFTDQHGASWWLNELAAPPGYEAALATSAPVSQVQMLAYPAGTVL